MTPWSIPPHLPRAVKFSVESTSQVASTWLGRPEAAQMEATFKVDSIVTF
jgi:hypothetical protein